MKSSSSYQLFSYHYDELTYDMPYNLWLDIIHHFKGKRQSVLDIGCGTGRLSRQLDFEEVHGMDRSEMMLEVAGKASDGVTYHHGDMKDFDLGTPFDMVTATVDVLNYCRDEAEVLDVLRQVHRHLNKDGLFIFDIHSAYKMNTDFDDITYSDETGHITYIWNALRGEDPLSVVHEMTFFIKDDDSELYRRFDETHVQRTYPHKEMLRMIDRSGFVIDTAFSDFDISNPVTEVCDRIFYVLRKK